MLFGHVAISALLHRHIDVDLGASVAGGLAPDVVDKTLCQVLHATPNGRMYAHTVVGLALSTAFSVFMASLELAAEVRPDGIHYHYFPFHLSDQRIGISEIADQEVRVYRPIVEYGGWGVRFGPKGKAYNVKGNRGVQLVLTNGKRVLFGSARADELSNALQSASKANPATAKSGKKT